MKLKILIISIFFGLLSISCNNDDENTDCTKNIKTYITSVNSPTTTGVINEKIIIEVEFQVANSSGRFGKFIETENGNTRIIEVEAEYKGCAYFDNAPFIITDYQFTPKKIGNYELKFKSSPTEYIIVNLTIN
jgi:hypothetical protein